MKSRKTEWIVILVVAATFVSMLGCQLDLQPLEVGELRTKSETVPLDDAESVNVVIDMAIGVLTMNGGASNLLEAEIVYNVEELEPEIEYRNGTLTVSFPDVRMEIGILEGLNDFRSEWDLRLNDDVPMDLSVETGAGVSTLNLGGLHLNSLAVTSGAGDVTLDLSGSSFLSSLDIEAGVGQLSLDLSGEWQADLEANIQAGLGQVGLLLPNTVCVRVGIDSGIANVNAAGFSMQGGSYVNAACGESDITLRIDIDAGVGNIDLELAD